jgi:hypothetical protein
LKKQEAILLDLLRVISHHRARLATPIRTVQKIYSDADLDNFPSADTIFGRGGVAASNRPLLMIEPPSRINGEDKTKTQNRSVRTSEQDGKTTNTRPAAGIKGDAKVGLTSVSDSKSRGKTTSDTKADTKIGDTPNPDTKEDTKAVAASVSDPKGRETATAKSSKPVVKTNSKIAEMSFSDPKEMGSVSDNSTQKVPDVKQTKSTSLGSVMQKSDNPSVSSSESSVDKASRIPTTQSRQEGERVPTPVSQPQTSRPVLEDNIVLGVALEGSKRTLPIDEGMVSPPSPAEGKEMAGSHTSEKNKKDGQFPTAPSATSGNQ